MSILLTTLLEIVSPVRPYKNLPNGHHMKITHHCSVVLDNDTEARHPTTNVAKPP